MGFAERHLSGQLESIARDLFEVKSASRGELIGLCPVHEDKKPSFSYNPSKDLCCCFGCGFKGDIIKLWWTVKGYGDEKEGFKAFCEEFGISDGLNPLTPKKDRPPKKDLPPLNDIYERLGPIPEDWISKLARTRAWSPGALEWLGIRQQTHYQKKDTKQVNRIRKPERLAIPIFDAAGDIRNIRLYKPGGKVGKFPKIMSWGADFGETRLFPPVPRIDGTILLCEGEPDTICAISQGFNAITQTSKPKKWTKDQLEYFKSRDVVIAFDADQPGQMYATEFAGPELLKVAKSVRILTWPDFMGRRDDGEWPEKNGQDLTDFFVKHKQIPVDLQRLIDAADHFEPPESLIDPQAYNFFERGVNDRLSFKPRLLAEKIMEEFKLLYCPDTSILYRWNGRYWEDYADEHLKGTALKMLGIEATQGRVQDAVFQAKALSTIPYGRMINDRIKWLCVKNGMLNIETFELRDHDPEFFATYELGVTFNPDSKDRCDRWLQFLGETVQTKEVIDQVQEFFGYCFYKKMPFAKCMLLLGPGSDGKSTLLKILMAMIGAENCASVNFNEMEDQFLRSTLYQKSINVCGEVGSKIIESTYFKAVTSGDRINAAFKHQNAFTFEPFCKMFFSGNKMARVKDTSDGLYRRLLPVKFKQQFMEGDPKTDPFLEEKLLAELSEIFLWSLVGLQRLLKNRRFTTCEETVNLMMDYKRLNNPVLCFVQDECQLKEAAKTKKDEVFKRYEKYCTDNKYRPYSRENFFRELYAAYDTIKQFRPRKNNPSREPYIRGIKLTGDFM